MKAFKLTTQRHLTVIDLFNGYADGLITDKELDYMLDLIWTNDLTSLDPFWIDKLEQHFGVDENGNLLGDEQ
jgi:hypothetical protein